MKRFSMSLALMTLAAFASSAPVSAQALEDLHDQRAEGGRWCMADHFHYSSSGGQSTRAAAEKEAIGSWSSFTAWEYGNQWGSWRIAGSRKASCSNLNGTWGCQVEARPCRPLSGAGPSRPRAKARPKAAAAPKQ